MPARLDDLPAVEHGDLVAEPAGGETVADVDGFDVLNSHAPTKQFVLGTIVWTDNDNEGSTRPESVAVQLMMNDALAEEMNVTQNDYGDWDFEFEVTSLLKTYPDAEFDIELPEIPEYTCEIDTSMAETGCFTVTYTLMGIPAFKTQSLILSGQLGLTFYMDLSMLTEEQRTDSYVEFTIDGLDGGTQIAPYDPNQTNGDGNYYAFICKVNSIQMADSITAVYRYADEEGTDRTVSSKECTVEGYLNYFTAESGAQLFALTQAINDYGYYAQQFLSQHAAQPWSPGIDHAEMAKVNTTAYSYTASELSDYAAQCTLKTTDLESVTYSLSLESNTEINLYVEPAQGYTGPISAAVGSTELEVVNVGRKYKVTISDISAHLLGNMYEVRITTNAGVSTVRVSALSYIYACMDDANPVKMVVSALYDYYLKTLDYRQSVQNNG